MYKDRRSKANQPNLSFCSSGTLQISEAIQNGMLRKPQSEETESSTLTTRPKTPRLCFLTHPGHTLIRGKNIIGRYFSPSKMVQDWRFSNVQQSHIGMFGLACHIVDMTNKVKNAPSAFTTPQLPPSVKNLKQTGACGVLVYPGRVATKYRRHSMPSWTTIWKYPLICFAMRTPYEAAQSMVFAATSDEITPGSYVSNCKVREHWKSRTLYNEKLCSDIVEWGRQQLKGSVSNVIKKERAAVAQQVAEEEKEKRKQKSKK